ncbi:hypothetical protein GLAREA_04603 [Glarea lozoyensis ATCC 20868]|uniref:CFEM domain-containing protein n=1 Tax=Glarea lozoyensis (strain ATCC 20868 / MF5171) TaxID=1116229 RepID=S3CMX9_GLAL2|nr:uncharacterized protein GLAREA_04603 [Glarea lozoyensis ATCC 20868]EPE27812.1 hypothetical protein GLAREA_04603 [Glarea lozoyensis ATCC 20868]
MKLSQLSFVIGFTSFAVAQNQTELVSQLPKCAYDCLYEAGQSSGCLDATNFSCFCGSNKEAIVKSAVPCIGKSCNTVQALDTQRIAAQICQAETPYITSVVLSIASSSAAAASSMARLSSSSTSQMSVSTTSSLSSTATSSSTPTSVNTGGSQTTTSSAAAQTSNSGSRLDAVGKVAGIAILAALAI